MLLFGIFGLNLLFFVDQKTWFDIGLHLLFYGFYYGVIGEFFDADSNGEVLQ